MANTTRSPINSKTQQKQILDFLEEGYVADWISKNGKYLTYGLVVILAIFVIFYRMSSTHTSGSEQEYIQASNDFSSFIKSTDISDPAVKTSFANLKSIMKDHPELHAAYDAQLAQMLLNYNHPSEAMPFAQRTIERTKINHISYYTEFASISLLLSENNYKDAIEKSLALQESLGQAINQPATTPRTFSDELFAINLFRIAMLQQLIGDKSGELKTWQLWLEYAGLKENTSPLPVNIHPQAFRLAIEQINVGSVSLADYIAYRETVLSNKP